MTTKTHSVRLPSRVLSLLADGFGDIGSGARAALLEAGRLTGTRLLDEMEPEADPENVGPERFWPGVSRALESRGLGALEYRLLGAGLAELTLEDGPESTGEDGGRSRPGCPFATGLLGGLLSGVADEPMAVLEVECTADGAPGCRFLAGEESRLARIGDRLREGASVEEAVREP